MGSLFGLKTSYIEMSQRDSIQIKDSSLFDNEKSEIVMLNLNKAEVISELKTNKYLNVFLVASPILAIITRMIIESLNLKNENILIVSLRNTSLEILPFNNLFIQPGNFDRYIEKIFFASPSGRKSKNS